MVYTILHSRLCNKRCATVHHTLVLALFDEERTVKSSSDSDLLSCIKSCVKSGWDRNSDVPDQSPHYQFPLLYLSAVLGKPKTLTTLLKNGLDASVRTQDGETALHGVTRLIYKGYPQNANVKKSVFKRIVSILLEHEPKLFLVKDNNGQTVLHTVSRCLVDAGPVTSGLWAGSTGKLSFFRDSVIFLVEMLCQLKESHDVTLEEFNAIVLAKDKDGKTVTDVLACCLRAEGREVFNFVTTQFPCLSSDVQHPVTEGEISSTRLSESPLSDCTVGYLDSSPTNLSQCSRVSFISNTHGSSNHLTLSPVSTIGYCDVNSQDHDLPDHPIIVRVDSLAPDDNTTSYINSLADTNHKELSALCGSKMAYNVCGTVSKDFRVRENFKIENFKRLPNCQVANEKVTLLGEKQEDTCSLENSLQFVAADDGLDSGAKLNIIQTFHQEYLKKLTNITDSIMDIDSEIEDIEKDLLKKNEEVDQLECQIAHVRSKVSSLLSKINSRQTKRKSLCFDREELRKKIKSCEATRQGLA